MMTRGPSGLNRLLVWGLAGALGGLGFGGSSSAQPASPPADPPQTERPGTAGSASRAEARRAEDRLGGNAATAYGALPRDQPTTRTGTRARPLREGASAGLTGASARFRPMGASTISGLASLKSSGPKDTSPVTITIDIEGASAGTYEIKLGDQGICARPFGLQVDIDAVSGRNVPGATANTGESPSGTEAASPPPRSNAFDTARPIGTFSVTSDGRGHFQDVLTSSSMRDNKLGSLTRKQIFILERRGSVNPSLADARGAVACGVIVPSGGSEPAS